MNTQPFFSIVVPTHNRPGSLADCLESIGRLRYPRSLLETIVVDDGSCTAPEAVVDRYRGRFRLELVVQSRAGPASARNKGAAAARGDFLAFTDDDCRPDPLWLQALAAGFRDAPEAAIGGRTINGLPNNIYSSASQLLVTYLYSYYNGTGGAASFFTSNNLAVPTDGFRALGGFDDTFPLAAGEDRDFCDRWVERGARLLHAPEAIVYHEHALDLPAFIRQHVNYGRGAFHFHQKRAFRGAKHVGVEPMAFYLDMLRWPLRYVGRSRAVMPATLLFLSQLANAGGFLFEWWSEAVRHQSRTPRRHAE